MIAPLPLIAAPAQPSPEPAAPAAAPRTGLLMRNDTILGVCEGLGQDLGIHPNLLRTLFAGSFYFNPVAVVSAYFALGLLVMVSRWAFPPVTMEVAAATQPIAPVAAAEADARLPLAA